MALYLMGFSIMWYFVARLSKCDKDKNVGLLIPRPVFFILFPFSLYSRVRMHSICLSAIAEVSLVVSLISLAFDDLISDSLTARFFLILTASVFFSFGIGCIAESFGQGQRVDAIVLFCFGVSLIVIGIIKLLDLPNEILSYLSSLFLVLIGIGGLALSRVHHESRFISCILIAGGLMSIILAILPLYCN